MKLFKWTPLAIWTVANFVGVGVLAFVDNSALRFISWIWVSFAITISGLVEIGGVFYHGEKSSAAADQDLDVANKTLDAILSKKDTH